LISTFKVYIQNGKVQRSHGEREKRDGEEWRDAQMKEMRDQSVVGRKIKRSRSNETPVE